MFLLAFVCFVSRQDYACAYWMDHHKTRWKDAVWVREETVTFWCGSGSGGRSRSLWQRHFPEFLLISQRTIHGFL